VTCCLTLLDGCNHDSISASGKRSRWPTLRYGIAYPIVKHIIPMQDGSQTDMYDLMGKDAVVFHHSVHSRQPADIPFVDQARAWFDTMWDNISAEFPA
jgi:hypothetical protein